MFKVSSMYHKVGSQICRRKVLLKRNFLGIQNCVESLKTRMKIWDYCASYWSMLSVVDFFALKPDYREFAQSFIFYYKILYILFNFMLNNKNKTWFKNESNSCRVDYQMNFCMKEMPYFAHYKIQMVIKHFRVSSFNEYNAR